MVLPEKIMEKYTAIKSQINQTASKVEQLALAGYINTGKIDVHLRKARRVFLEKSKIVLQSIDRYFKDCETVFNETSLYVKIKLDGEFDRVKIERELTESSIKIMPYKNGNEFGLSFSGIPTYRIDEGIKLISEIIYK